MTEFEKELLSRIDQLMEENRQLREELKGPQVKKPTPAQQRKEKAPKGQAARVITKEEFDELIDTMREGGSFFQPNERAAAIFQLQASLGLRLGDVLALRQSSFVKDGGRWRLNIVEQKTGKPRTFAVPAEIIAFIQEYREANDIGPKELLFPVKIRAVQKYLAKVVDYLDLENVTSHSFRKYYATEIYNEHGYNIELVRQFLQHSSTETTQKYIGVKPAQIEEIATSSVHLR